MARLGDVCKIVSGSTPSTTATDYWDGDIKWITPAELDENSFYITDSVRHITELGRTKTGLSYMPIGTVILSSRAPIGKTAIAGCEMCCNQGFKNLICSDKIHNEYLYFFLKGKTEFLNSLGRGATFKELSKSIVENIEIPLPSYEEQIKISVHMRKIEELLRLRKQQLSKLDELIKSRFIELFGDTITNERKWQTLVWSNVLTIRNGRNQKAVENPKGQYPICGSGGIMGYADEYITEKNSVIIGRKGNINKPILMRERFWNVDTAFGLEPNEQILSVDYLFLYCLFFDFEQLNKAVTIPSLTKADLQNIVMPVPPIELQNQFATFVEQVDKSKLAIQKSLEKLEILKKSLMQQYFG